MIRFSAKQKKLLHMLAVGFGTGVLGFLSSLVFTGQTARVIVLGALMAGLSRMAGAWLAAKPTVPVEPVPASGTPSLDRQRSQDSDLL